jgi:hypothetical protein
MIEPTLCDAALQAWWVGGRRSSISGRVLMNASPSTSSPDGPLAEEINDGQRLLFRGAAAFFRFLLEPSADPELLAWGDECDHYYWVGRRGEVSTEGRLPRIRRDP